MKSKDLFLTRREMLARCGMGMGALALTSELQGAKRPPLPFKAKRVLHLLDDYAARIARDYHASAPAPTKPTN